MQGMALGFSYTRSAIWLRLHLKNPGDRTLEHVLEISYALLSQVDFYQPGLQGYQRIEAGYSRPVPAQAYRHRFIALPVSLPAGADQYVYLRVQTPNSLNVPARLWSRQAFQAHQPADYAIQALYFGIVLAIGFYNLMLFFALRDANYLLYVTFSACVAIALATFTGMGSEFVWGVAPAWTTIGVNVPASLASVAMLIFTRRILETRQSVPRIDQLIKVFIGANAASVFLLILWFHGFAPFFVAMNLITSLLILATGVVCLRLRQRGALFFVIAFSGLFLANVLTHLRNLGLLGTNIFTSDGLQVGSTIEMLLLSLALADRFNLMRQDKIAAQAEALRAQGELVQKLKASEELLEARVANRTAQLQTAIEELETISTTDALTGIANRRHFDATLASEWTRSARLGQSMALGLVDIDWFKEYNDQYGHQAGDECLRQVAAFLTTEICRTGDLLARYGGEEFVFIALGTDSENALNKAQSVCRALHALALPHELSGFGCITVSIGVAALVPKRGDSSEMLIRLADERLYQAKAQGKNRAVGEDSEG